MQEDEFTRQIIAHTRSANDYRRQIQECRNRGQHVPVHLHIRVQQDEEAVERLMKQRTEAQRGQS